ncbi:mortality factor 4-like protein 2 [Arvicanthis niloticus]
MGVELSLPGELKSHLVEDWDLVTKQKQLFQLPAEKSVDTILAEYVTFVKSQGLADNREYSVDELVFGIRVYFNDMLATQLLYQFERPQYAEIHLAYPGIPTSQIYGAPHLLRLFVNIGTALAHSPLNRQSLLLVCNYMHGFLEYLVQNSTSLFHASNYRVASAEYCCKAL